MLAEVHTLKTTLNLPWYFFALAAGALFWAVLFFSAIMLWRRHRRRMGR